MGFPTKLEPGMNHHHGDDLVDDEDFEAACRVCGCTENQACPGGCYWVQDPMGHGDLCSSCLPRVQAEMAGSVVGATLMLPILIGAAVVALVIIAIQVKPIAEDFAQGKIHVRLSELRRLKLEPGEVLAITPTHDWDEETITAVINTLQQPDYLGPDARVIVAPSGTEFVKIAQDDAPGGR